MAIFIVDQDWSTHVDVKHEHQTMTASALKITHEHEGGEHTHTHEQDGETFHWIAIVEEPEPPQP